MVWAASAPQLTDIFKALADEVAATAMTRQHPKPTR
jgi:hypothetical protein